MLIAPQPAGGAVWLMDAQNLLHRYHHAAPVRVNSRGQQVHAVQGLAHLATRIREQHEPKAIGVVFDAGHSGREALLPEYKAGRAPPPAELVTQIEMAHEFLPAKGIGVSTIRVDGYEADDVIAEMTLRARAAGDRVYLVTSDKDLMALISDDTPEIAVFNRATGKGAEGWRLYQETDAEKRLGVRPNRILDLLALTGDDADNIPGVPGIGPKTAAELLKQYGALDVLLSVISTVARKLVREALREHAEQIRLARRVLEFVRVPPTAIMESIRHAPTPRPALAPSYP